MAQVAQQIQAALAADRRDKKATDIPVFYGDKAKDTLTARQLVQRVQRAAGVANWDNVRKSRELALALRGQALIWLGTLERMGLNPDDWNVVRTEFLASYEPRYTAKANCSNLQDLYQKPGESVTNFLNRVNEIQERFNELKPTPVIPAVEAAIPGVVAAAIPAAGVAGHDVLDVVKNEGYIRGVDDSEKFLIQQIFIAGLRDEIRAKVMEANKATLYETQKYAKEVEAITNEKKRTGGHVTAVQKQEEEDAEDLPDGLSGLDEEEVQAINAIRRQQGKKPYRFNKGRSSNGRFTSKKKSSGTFSGKCNYCQIQGHKQFECRKRLREQGQRNGNRINPVQEDNQVTMVSQEPSLGLMALNY